MMKNKIGAQSELLGLILVISLTLFINCGGDGGGGADSNSNTGTGGNINTKVYNGTADIIIDYYDYDFFGNLIYIEQKTYQYDVEVETGPPKNVGSVYEQNAINLQIMTTTMGGEGTFGMSSAILNVALQGGPVLLQYWDLNYANQLIDGTLVDTHIAESAAANQLYAWEDLAGFVSVLLFLWIREQIFPEALPATSPIFKLTVNPQMGLVFFP